MTDSQLEKQIQKILASGTKREYKGFCFRNVKPQYADKFSVQSAMGSLVAGGRFNFNGHFGALYLSETPFVCLEEGTRFTDTSLKHSAEAARKNAAVKSLPIMFVGFYIELSNVLDLTDPDVLSEIGITEEEMRTTDWFVEQENEREAITQKIGRIAKESGFEAIVARSARCDGKNIIVFCGNVRAPSRVSVVDRKKLYSNASWLRLPVDIKGDSNVISLVHRLDDDIALGEHYLELLDEYCERVKGEHGANHAEAVLEECLISVGF